MVACVQETASITRFIRKLRGGSQPILAEASDGQTYVVKFTDNLQGPNLAFNESAGTELFRTYNLPVSPWQPLKLNKSFINSTPECWIETSTGSSRPTAGLCFGSRYLGSKGKYLKEILPGNSFKRVRNQKDFWLAWLIDVCIGHTDHRQAVFTEEADGGFKATFIDHGHMFGGPNGNERRQFMVSAYLDRRIYPDATAHFFMQLKRIVVNLDTDTLWKKVARLPDEWKTDSALHSFARGIETLLNKQIVQGVIDTIADSQRQMVHCEKFALQDPSRPPLSILRSGIRPAEPKRSAVA
jgi:hypothetical protein